MASCTKSRREGCEKSRSTEHRAPDGRRAGAADERPPPGISRSVEPEECRFELLELDGGAGALQLGLRLLGVFLAGLFEHWLRGGVDQVLGLFEAEAGEGPYFLDDLDLLVAGGGEDDVELVLLLDRGASAPPPATGAAATATGAAAVTPKRSSKSFRSSESSRTVRAAMLSRISSLVAMVFYS